MERIILNLVFGVLTFGCAYKAFRILYESWKEVRKDRKFSKVVCTESWEMNRIMDDNTIDMKLIE